MNQQEYMHLLRVPAASDGHDARYGLSAVWVEPYMRPGRTVLDFGSPSRFTDLMQRCFPAVRISATDRHDLRYPLPYQDASCDLVLCMEVVEHVKDTNEAEKATFSGDGIRAMLASAYRVLKPGGMMFLTTPNVCGWHNLDLWLQHRHPYFYQPHHRELSLADVVAYVTGAGFSIHEHKAVNVWGNHTTPDEQRSVLQRMIRSEGFSSAGREDCIFLLAKKS